MWFIKTITDEQWDKIRRGAAKTEAREGGMFSKKAAAQRKASSRQHARKDAN
jgi:hypothetical protein